MPNKIVSWSNPSNDKTDFPHVAGFSAYITSKDALYKLGRVAYASDDSGWWVYCKNNSGSTVTAGTNAVSNSTFLLTTGTGVTTYADFADQEFGWAKATASKPF